MSHRFAEIEKSSATATFDASRTIHSYFADVVRKHPEKPAIFFGDGFISYSDLDCSSNQFARFLTSKGVRAGSLVGLFLPRSLDAVVAMLGILKAGAAFVPLDPAYPFDHLSFIASDAKPIVMVTAAHMVLSAQPRPWSAPTVFIDAEEDAIALESAAPLAEIAMGDDLAYVMYTSGTTGRPKGVMVPHRGVTRLACNSFVELGQGDVVLQLAPLAFDASTFEIWSCLLNGAALAIVGPAQPSFGEIGEAIEKHDVTTAWLTASLFHAIVDHQLEILRPLRQLIAGGDVLSPRHVRRVLDAMPQCRLVNGYGPTENTTFTCCHTIARDAPADAPTPVGRPIDHTQIHVLDLDLRPVAPGEIGELFAAGEGVALGYLNRPDLTAEKFLPDPFCGQSGRLMYRTGDLVRQRPDDVVEFVGRTDRQVKIRGKRVELDEVEALVRRLPEVADAATDVRARTGGERKIVAYVTMKICSSFDAAESRRKMLEFAPNHMIPAHFVILEELPRTPNGKVDRAALPDPVDAAEAEAQPIAALSEVESALAAIWSRLLKIGSVGLDANFFDLGGASLDVMALQEEIRTRFSRELPMTALFEFTTIRALAAHLQKQDPAPSRSAAESPDGGLAMDDINNRRLRQAEALRRVARNRARAAL